MYDIVGALWFVACYHCLTVLSFLRHGIGLVTLCFVMFPICVLFLSLFTLPWRRFVPCDMSFCSIINYGLLIFSRQHESWVLYRKLCSKSQEDTSTTGTGSETSSASASPSRTQAPTVPTSATPKSVTPTLITPTVMTPSSITLPPSASLNQTRRPLASLSLPVTTAPPDYTLVQERALQSTSGVSPSSSHHSSHPYR